jgi:ribosome-associated protein
MLSDAIVKILEEKKADNIVCFDLSKRGNLYDFSIIASGTSSRHTQSLARALLKELKKHVLHVEGMTLGDWVLIDCNDVIVHIFKKELREHYNLEELWS